MKNLLAIVLLVTFIAPAWAGLQNNCKIVYEAELTATQTSTRLRLPNPNRKCLLIQNKGSTAVYVKATAAQTTSQEGISISSTGNWEPYIVPTNALYFQTGGSSTSTITILEGE